MHGTSPRRPTEVKPLREGTGLAVCIDRVLSVTGIMWLCLPSGSGSLHTARHEFYSFALLFPLKASPPLLHLQLSTAGVARLAVGISPSLGMGLNQRARAPFEALELQPRLVFHLDRESPYVVGV